MGVLTDPGLDRRARRTGRSVAAQRRQVAQPVEPVQLIECVGGQIRGVPVEPGHSDRLPGAANRAVDNGFSVGLVAGPRCWGRAAQARRRGPCQQQAIERAGIGQFGEAHAAGYSPRRRRRLSAYAALPPEKLAVPATRTSAPAADALRAGSGLIPPSTSSSIGPPPASLPCPRARVLSRWLAM